MYTYSGTTATIKKKNMYAGFILAIEDFLKVIFNC